MGTGTAFINAVFYGIKTENGSGGTGSGENENGSSKEGACSSSGVLALPTTTRKHVLQVSTYQVSIKLDSNLKSEI